MKIGLQLYVNELESEMFVLRKLIDYPDFYEIPNYSRYGVKEDGTVINRITSEILTGSINPDGYHNVRLTDDYGKTLTWGRHRLIAYIFKNPGVDITDMVVNHENGIKSDNVLSNLEWTTYQGNAEHAGANGLTEKCKPMSVRDVDTGEIVKFPSVLECARVFNITKDAVLHRLKFNGERVFPERKQYRFGHDDLPWYIPSDESLEYIQHGRERRVLVKDLSTGIIATYDKAGDAAESIGVAVSTLSMWLGDNNGQPIRSGFVQVKWYDDSSEWRIPTHPYSEYSENTGKRAVSVTNKATKSLTIYISGIQCCEALGLKPTTLNYRLKSKGQTVFPDGNTFSYLDEYESGPNKQ